MPGPSNWTSAFTHPDPLDPNDAQRQRTQARAGDYPYDQPTSYGASISTAMDGDAYQDGSGHEPPVPRDDDPDFRPLSVWDRISDSVGLSDDDSDLSPVEIGMQGRNATTLGYGKNGLREIEVDLARLKNDFRSMGDCDGDPTLSDLLTMLGFETDVSEPDSWGPSTYELILGGEDI